MPFSASYAANLWIYAITSARPALRLSACVRALQPIGLKNIPVGINPR